MLAVIGAAGWGFVQISRSPEIAGPPTSPADGIRAQQKIFDLLRHAGGGRPYSVFLSEPEVNAFLARHLGEDGNLPLRRLAVRLPSAGHAEVAGQLPFRQLGNVSPFSALAGLIP